MLFENQETARVVGLIKKGAEVWTAGELGEVLRLAKQRKHPLLDETSKASQIRYRGNQKGVLADALGKRFKKTEMPIAAINWLRLFARLDAGVYVVPSDRFLVDENEKRLDKNHDASKLWRWALEKALFHARMAECERRALIPPGLVVGKMNWLNLPGEPVGQPSIDLYCAHDVEVLCHWQAPTSWAFKYLVAFRQASPDPTSPDQWYDVWSRMPPLEIGGEWGPWSHVVVSTSGKMAQKDAKPIPLKGTLLPAFLFQLSTPDGYTFCLEDPDLIDTVDDLNMQRSNESLVILQQGHNQLWTNDPTKEAKGIEVGPDKLVSVVNGAQVGVISYSPQLEQMRASRERGLEELATSRGNSPHAYIQKAGGPPQSGIAMRVENLTHDTRVDEQATVVTALEQEEILPVLKDMLVHNHPKGAVLKPFTPRMNPRKRPTIEEPANKQTRLSAAKKEGWISDARGAVEMELYADEDAARTALEEIAKSKPKVTPPPEPPPGGEPPPGKKPFPPRPANDDNNNGGGEA